MRLYELVPAMAALSAEADEGADVTDALAALDGALQEKCESIAYLGRNWEAEAETLRAEEVRLAKKRHAIEANAARLREYVRTQMLEHGVLKIKTPVVTFAIVEGPPRVEIENEALIPALYTRTRTEPDKAAILAAHKDDGEIVPGTKVVRDWQLRIR